MDEMTKDPLDRNDPMMQNLPIVTSCTFYSIGRGGGEEATQVTKLNTISGVGVIILYGRGGGEPPR